MNKAKFLRCGNTIAFLGDKVKKGNEWEVLPPWRATHGSINLAKKASHAIQCDAAGKYRHTGQLRVVDKLPASAGV